jgi:hypothetical protein
MAIQVVCGCGRQLRVSEAHAGRPVKCPGCGATHVVPAERFAAGGDAPGQARQRPARPEGQRDKLVLLVLLLLVLLGAGVAGWWFLFRKGGQEIDDLSLVPPDAQAFVSVRLAELWKTPSVRQALDRALEQEPNLRGPEAQLEEETGLRPEEVERATLAAMDSRDLVWLVIKTLEPYDQRKVLSRLHELRRHRGLTYHVGTDLQSGRLAMHFASPRVLVIGPEEGVRRCLEVRAGPARTGPLAPLIARCAEPHQALGGLQVPERARKGEGIPILLQGLVKPLLEVQTASFTLDVADEAVFEVRGQLESEEKAKKLQKAIPRLRAQAKLVLPVMGALVGGGNRAQALAQLPEILDTIKPEQKGNEVIAVVKTDPAEVVQALLVLPWAGGR